MLIRSISGIRGLVDEDLKNDSIIKYANALNELFPEGVIYAGRDSRPSGEDIAQVMIDELIMLGRTVIYCGIVPTPTVQYMVHISEAVGGFIITASHNPIEWNGIKFLREDSTFFHKSDCEKLFNLADNFNAPATYPKEKGMLWEEKNAIYKHTVSCSSLQCIDLNKIRSKKFKVVVDAVNSTGGIAVPNLLNKLDVEVVKLYCDPNGEFPHNPEPLKENLTDLSKLVIKEQADFGIVVDPDVDRLAFVSENGEVFGEEYTLVACADYFLKNKPGITVSNLSSSRALKDITESYGCEYFSSAVGEVNVVEKMKEKKAVIGGEGNGGIILPEFHYGRDALVGIAVGAHGNNICVFGGSLSP